MSKKEVFEKINLLKNEIEEISFKNDVNFINLVKKFNLLNKENSMNVFLGIKSSEKLLTLTLENNNEIFNFDLLRYVNNNFKSFTKISIKDIAIFIGEALKNNSLEKKENALYLFNIYKNYELSQIYLLYPLNDKKNINNFISNMLLDEKVLNSYNYYNFIKEIINDNLSGLKNGKKFLEELLKINNLNKVLIDILGKETYINFIKEIDDINLNVFRAWVYNQKTNNIIDKNICFEIYEILIKKILLNRTLEDCFNTINIIDCHLEKIYKESPKKSHFYRDKLILGSKKNNFEFFDYKIENLDEKDFIFFKYFLYKENLDKKYIEMLEYIDKKKYILSNNGSKKEFGFGDILETYNIFKNNDDNSKFYDIFNISLLLIKNINISESTKDIIINMYINEFKNIEKNKDSGSYTDSLLETIINNFDEKNLNKFAFKIFNENISLKYSENSEKYFNYFKTIVEKSKLSELIVEKNIIKNIIKNKL